MSVRPVALLLFSLSLLTVVPNAFASTDPIPGVDVVVRRKPPKGFPTINAETNDKGSIDLPRLQPGDYELVLDAKSLLAATTASGHAPTPNDNPITSINITLPGNPDDKLATSPDVSAGTPIAFTIPKGHLGVHIEIGQSMQARTDNSSTAATDNKILVIVKKDRSVNAESSATPLAIADPPPQPNELRRTGYPNLPESKDPSELKVPSGSILTGPCRPPYLCIAGVDVAIKDSKGKTLGHGKTDPTGAFVFRITNIRANKQSLNEPLTLDVDGKSLVAVMDKLYPQTVPAKKSGGSSFSLGLGVGGFGGGGGSTRTTTQGGAALAGAGKGEGTPTQATTNSGSSTSGGIGVSIPITLHGKSKTGTTTTTPPPPPSVLIALLLPAVQPARETNTYSGPTNVNAGTITKSGQGTLTLSSPNSVATTTCNSAPSTTTSGTIVCFTDGHASRLTTDNGSTGTTPTGEATFHFTDGHAKTITLDNGSTATVFATNTPYSRDSATAGLHLPFQSAGDDGSMTVRLTAVPPQPPSPASTVGTPIQGTPVPIDHDPEEVAAQSTSTSTSTCTKTTCLSNAKQIGLAVNDNSGQILTGPCKPPYLCLADVALVVKDSSGQIVGTGKTDSTGAAHISAHQTNSLPLESLTFEVDGKSLAQSVDRLDKPKPPSPQSYPVTRFTITVAPNPNAYQGTTSINAGVLQYKTEFTAEIPYCAGTASQNMRLTVPVLNGSTGSGPQATATELGVVTLIILGWGWP